MTKDEFEAGYAERSNITVAKGYELGIFPGLPCDCGAAECDGWQRRRTD